MGYPEWAQDIGGDVVLARQAGKLFDEAAGDSVVQVRVRGQGYRSRLFVNPVPLALGCGLFADVSLRQRHVHHFELHPVGAAEVNRVVSAQCKRKLTRSIENLGSQHANQLVDLINLLVPFNIERDVMKARFVAAHSGRHKRLSLLL